MSNQRDGERVSMLGDIPGEIMVLEPMIVKELSRGGATLETRFSLQLNSLHDLRLVLGERTVVVKGRVVHSKICDMDQETVLYRSVVECVEPSDRVIRSITAGRGLPAGGAATRSNIPDILARRALPSGRRPPAFAPRITRPGH